ncbi:MAG: hypothetical protein ACRCXE_02785, partial [Metamycoplasmataceae bacterium]
MSKVIGHKFNAFWNVGNEDKPAKELFNELIKDGIEINSSVYYLDLTQGMISFENDYNFTYIELRADDRTYYYFVDELMMNAKNGKNYKLVLDIWATYTLEFLYNDTLEFQSIRNHILNQQAYQFEDSLLNQIPLKYNDNAESVIELGDYNKDADSWVIYSDWNLKNMYSYIQVRDKSAFSGNLYAMFDDIGIGLSDGWETIWTEDVKKAQIPKKYLRNSMIAVPILAPNVDDNLNPDKPQSPFAFTRQDTEHNLLFEGQIKNPDDAKSYDDMIDKFKVTYPNLYVKYCFYNGNTIDLEKSDNSIIYPYKDFYWEQGSDYLTSCWNEKLELGGRVWYMYIDNIFETRGMGPKLKMPKPGITNTRLYFQSGDELDNHSIIIHDSIRSSEYDFWSVIFPKYYGLYSTIKIYSKPPVLRTITDKLFHLGHNTLEGMSNLFNDGIMKAGVKQVSTTWLSHFKGFYFGPNINSFSGSVYYYGDFTHYNLDKLNHSGTIALIPILSSGVPNININIPN